MECDVRRDAGGNEKLFVCCNIVLISVYSS